ncbi:PTS fructose transporter subunit IIC [Oenococcus kitaharae]|uniref:PTS system fructose-specific IIB component n=1 Tax=Oenococcus kitaharae DSM 17330 TaxID=1045004 RepID=G9WIS6_9LACO|nr:PTS fructose transporter subunit IIC [Oenococcus kitaharae]EHN58375.1 PTS system fructose-specific IIB component [Oenococcus kitaharae DSM 17330]OEY81460.1 hypothetical protein NT95_08090 [Oenococcus kitaharae]OEY82948.1 hypothetical protein NV75_06190 [Oenococcus kitaharae]OEY84508.1 hypothetical protein NT96_04445 [Oenococcus kitaharae]
MHDFIDVFQHLRKHLLAGVSYLIPVVVVGGIMTGLGVAFGGPTVYKDLGSFPAFLFTLGKTGLNLMAPVIAAYIGFSIADKAAIAPGFIVGQLAQDSGAGFLGGVFAGLFCGIVIMFLKKIKVPKNFSALVSIIVIPCIAALSGAMIMNFAVTGWVVAFIHWLTTFVSGLGTSNLILIGIAFGIIGSFDLGLFGSKALSAVCLSMLATIDPKTGLPIMIAQRLLLTTVTATVVPPLVCALVTLVRPKIFTTEEKEVGRAALFLGAFGITEGSIPLALSDAKVYAGCIVGATAGAISTILLGAGTMVNWGGIPTFPGTTNVWLYALAVLIGTLVGTLFIILTKHQRTKLDDTTDQDVKVTQEGEEFDLNL